MAEELQAHATGFPARARSIAAMSILVMPIIASMARFAAALSGSVMALRSARGGDFPGQAELILAPAILRFLAIFSNDRVPVTIGLFLAVGMDLKTDRLIELEIRAAVKAGEWHAQHGELDDKLATLLAVWPACRLACLPSG
jgi:hypothetical protein